MTCTRPRSTHILFVSAVALAAFAAAPALSEPPPAAAPQALPDPLHPCTVLLCLPQPGNVVQSTTPTSDAASGLATGKRMHKPYTLTAPAPVNDEAAPRPIACGATEVQPLKVASDPEEGGQIARTATPKPKPKPKISDMTVTSKTDTASPTLAQPAPSGTTPCGPGGR